MVFMAFSMSLCRSSSRRLRYRYSLVLIRRPWLSYWGAGEGDLESSQRWSRMMREDKRRKGSMESRVGGFKTNVPIAISGNNVIYPKLLANLFDSKMQRIGLKLLASHVGHNSSGKAHQASSLVLGSISPSVALLAALRPIRFASYTRRKAR